MATGSFDLTLRISSRSATQRKKKPYPKKMARLTAA
jgi:hypothetical protein